MTAWISLFSEGDASQKDLLGGKGAGLAEMIRMGLPVPPGFTFTTELCREYYRNNKHLPENFTDMLKTGVATIEEHTGHGFGSAELPLLVSVRSGARVSMPGMMDTILNLGMNDTTADALAKLSGDLRFALDCHRRFIQMFGNVVQNIPLGKFEDLLDDQRMEQGCEEDKDLSPDSLRKLIEAYRAVVLHHTGAAFPEDVWQQLALAVQAVFDSWHAPRAITYRKLHNYPEDWGTAVNVQAMVFGNLGDDSATGVAFTRDPSTGENLVYGEYLENAQGEDVVAGIRTPHPISLAQSRNMLGGGSEDEDVVMEKRHPKLYEDLRALMTQLETHYRDMQDIEFTVQSGKLYILQTRSGKRTARAAVNIAVDMVKAGMCGKLEALRTIQPSSLDQLLHPVLDPTVAKEVIGTGLPASPGAASGKVVFGADEAVQLAQAGEDVILMRPETSPEDIHGMHAARGIVTARGGMTSHAAVVARGMGRACICGMRELTFDAAKGCAYVRDRQVNVGDLVTIDGGTGELILGAVPTVLPELEGAFSTIMEWADELRTIRVRANAETEGDLRIANMFGAEGIGLARTEHMFFQAERISAVRRMILSESMEGRRLALEELLPYQRGDFATIFRSMAGLPVTVRLLDPPLHEFLPRDPAAIADLAASLEVSSDSLRRTIENLEEVNPMLGHRGCRLLLTYPEIARMQVTAIFGAMADVRGEGLALPQCEIMIPLVADVEELRRLRVLIAGVAVEAEQVHGMALPYQLGTMIELPRAALTADKIAAEAEFFSFGTNDLTQTTWGISRDDANKVLGYYTSTRILAADPFVTLDVEGVGALIRMAFAAGRAARPELKVGICGEHGGDPASVAFCVELGLDYVSCSPYRIPIARLAAAQAVKD